MKEGQGGENKRGIRSSRFFLQPRKVGGFFIIIRRSPFSATEAISFSPPSTSFPPFFRARQGMIEEEDRRKKRRKGEGEIQQLLLHFSKSPVATFLFAHSSNPEPRGLPLFPSVCINLVDGRKGGERGQQGASDSRIRGERGGRGRAEPFCGGGERIVNHIPLPPLLPKQ